MDCKDTQERIPLMQKGLLTENESIAVREHLTECPDCRNVEALERQMTDTLDSMFSTLPEPVVSVPSGKRHSIFSLMSIRGGLAIAAVVILAFILSLVLREGAIDINPVTLHSPVRDVQVMHAEFRAPLVREAGDMTVKVDQLKKNIVWVSIQN